MVEGARLESVYTGNCIKGSNPFLSARKNGLTNKVKRFFVVSVLHLQFDKIGNISNHLITD